MTQNNLHINSASVTDKGLSKKRPQNEDSCLVFEERGLYVVADGVGGAQAGDVASQMATEVLKDAFTNLKQGGDAEERMELAINQANRSIHQMATDLPQLRTMATTVVVLHVNGNIATIGHVGDSRLYRLDPDGNLYRETQDHSIVEEEVRAGRLTPQQAEVHPSRNVISRALGAEETVEIDMKTIMFEPNTTFLVCTDGVTRHWKDEELQELLLTEEDTKVICERIKAVCYARGAEDNLTAIVVRINDNAVESFNKKDNLKDGNNPLEEETVSSSRPPLVKTSVLNQSSDETLLEIDKQLEIPVKEENNRSVSIIDNEKKDAKETTITETPVTDAERDIKSYTMDEEAGNGLLGTIFSVLPWVLLFLLLGAGGYYIWNNSKSSSNEEDSIPSQEQNLPFNTFENNRRNVDENPAKYSADNAQEPRDSVDYFLLGRAYLLQEDYKNAKLAFRRAKEQLDDGVAPINKNVLENEIAMGLAIAESEDARQIFQDEIKAIKGIDNIEADESSNPDNTEVDESNNPDETGEAVDDADLDN